MTSPLFRVWDSEACERVHEATLSVLTETGVEMRHARARELCADAGALVDGTRVRLGREVIERALAAAPRDHDIKPRGGDTAPVKLVPGTTHYGTGPDCLYVADPRSGSRRRARLADVRECAALCERLPNIDFVMSMGLPEDAPVEVVDLAQFAAMMAATRKPIVVSSPNDGASLRTMREMAALGGEADSFACLAMSSPPLTLDYVALDKALVCGELGIPLVLAPAPSAGSTAPATVAATVVVSNAEVLAGLVVHQLADPGAPFIYGAGVGVLDMRAMVDVYVVPEVLLGDQAACDLAGYYGLPSWSYAGCSDSKVFDEQASLEAALATVLGALSRATLLHDVGYLESGLQSSPEALVLGDELAGFARTCMADVPVGAEAVLVEEIAAAGPGGSHLARPRTRRLHRTFWRPSLLDHAMYNRWHAAGGATLGERVRKHTAALLDAPPAFTLDPAVCDALDRLVADAARTSGSDVKGPTTSP